ncbi:MAG: orotate phosphoribosyltransferase [Ignavibacteria bacterium]|nr:orotate phosphoribosyltransferase [Ignavibacteria bacterium]
MSNNISSLLKVLKNKSVSYGDFTLSSGKKSKYYIDSKLTTFDPKGISLIGEIFFERINSLPVKADAIGGLTLGADQIAISTIIFGLKCNTYLKAFTVRKEPKEHGMKKHIEGNLSETDKVVIIDDVITTGSSTIKAIEAVEAIGAEIIKVIALVDRCEGGREKIIKRGYEVDSIFTVNELIDKNYLNPDNGFKKSNSFDKKRILQS